MPVATDCGKSLKSLQPSRGFITGGSNVSLIETMDEYRLACTACSFSTVVAGDVEAVYDEIEAHQAEFESDREVHLVDFEVIGST